MSFKTQSSRVAAFVVAGIIAVSTIAFAQLLTYNKTATSSTGLLIPVFNAQVTDSVIPDGTVLMVDSTTAANGGVTRIGVRPFSGTATTRVRVVGIAYGNIPLRANGGNGQMLIWGYHNNVKMGISTTTTNQAVKVAQNLYGALLPADSLSLSVGWFLGYNSRSTAANARGKVFINCIGGKSITIL